MARKLKARNLIIILAIVSFAILIVPTLIYWGNFGGYKLSDSPGDWGVFGDYMGGVLNPLLSIVNLIVLGYLTIFVSEQDSRMALNQFRYDIYLKLKTKSTALDKYTTKEELENIIKDIEYFKDFDFLFDNKSIYKQKINNLSGILMEVNQGVKGLDMNQPIKHITNSDNRGKIYANITDFDKEFNILLLLVQIEILGISTDATTRVGK